MQKVRYAAKLGAATSAGLKLNRRFVLLSTRATAAGVELRARIVDGKAGTQVTLRRASLRWPGGPPDPKLGRNGSLRVVLPHPTAAEKLAIFQVFTDRSSSAWMLPVVVRAAG